MSRNKRRHWDQPASFNRSFIYLLIANKFGVPETVRDRRVLLHIHRQIQEVLVFAAHLKQKQRANAQGHMVCRYDNGINDEQSGKLR